MERRKKLLKLFLTGAAAMMFVMLVGTPVEAKKVKKKNGMITPSIASATRVTKRLTIDIKLKKKVKGAKAFQIQWKRAGQKKKSLIRKSSKGGKVIKRAVVHARPVYTYKIRVRAFKKKKGEKLYSRWSAWKTVKATRKETKISKVNNFPMANGVAYVLEVGSYCNMTEDMEKITSVVCSNPSRAKVSVLQYHRMYEHQYGTDQNGKTHHLRSTREYPTWRIESVGGQLGNVDVTITGEDENGTKVSKTRTIVFQKDTKNLFVSRIAFVKRWIKIYIKDEMSDREKIKAITDYLNRVSYSSDKYDMFTDLLMPGETRTVKAGVCLQGAEFAEMVCHEVGIKAMVRTARLENMGGLIPAHANIFVWLEGKRYVVETQPGAMAGTLFDLHPEEKDKDGGFTKEDFADVLVMQDIEDGKITYEQGPRNREVGLWDYKDYLQYNVKNGVTKKNLTVEYRCNVKASKIGSSTFIEFYLNKIGTEICTLNSGVTSENPLVLRKESYIENSMEITGAGTAKMVYKDAEGRTCEYNITAVDSGKSTNEITVEKSTNPMLRLGNTDTCGEVIEAVSSDETKLEPLNDGRYGFRACETGTVQVEYKLQSGITRTVIVHIV